MTRSHPVARWAAVAALLAGTLSATAAETGWSLNVGGGHTDNATRTADNKISDTLTTAGIAGMLRHETRRLNASLEGEGMWLAYLDDTFDDDFFVSGHADLVFGVIPERILWTVEDTLRQIAVDQFAPVTPENRQTANLFTTGPDLIFRLQDRSELRLSGRFSTTSYEETDVADDRQARAELTWLHRVSPRTSWGAAISQARIEYDLPGDPGYDQQELYATLQAEGARQTIRLDLGASRVADGGDDFTNPLVRLEWERQLRPSLRLNASGGVLYRNTSDRFSQQGLGAPQGTNRVVVSNAPAEARYGDMRLSYERSRTAFGVTAGFTRESDARDEEFSERTWRAAFTAGRRVRPSLRALIFWGYEDRELEGVDGGADETQTAGAMLDWRLGRSSYLTLGYRREDRDSGVAIGTYEDNLIYLTFGYRHGTLAEANAPGWGGF